MTRAIGELLPLAFSALQLRRISARVLAHNVASAKVLEHNGFCLEGTMRNAAIKNGEICDVMVWGKVVE
ncbi:MAG: GNAT family N-acetyltransferase [Bacteroidales bacterium]|nr:GNAT family N-acetyltransferase [Bacteroidales bacterium]